MEPLEEAAGWDETEGQGLAATMNEEDADGAELSGDANSRDGDSTEAISSEANDESDAPVVDLTKTSSINEEEEVEPRSGNVPAEGIRKSRRLVNRRRG